MPQHRTQCLLCAGTPEAVPWRHPAHTRSCATLNGLVAKYLINICLLKMEGRDVRGEVKGEGKGTVGLALFQEPTHIDSQPRTNKEQNQKGNVRAVRYRLIRTSGRPVHELAWGVSWSWGVHQGARGSHVHVVHRCLGVLDRSSVKGE